jgi:Cu(I)/Ag(I) efflux system protein CusF
MRKFFFAMSLAFATISLQAWPTTLPSEAADPASQHETISGVVQKVDESGGKVTLEHGPIKSLGMDLGMTMVFAVQDTAQLKGLKPGDKVRFEPAQINGQFTVVKIEKTN